MVINKKANFLGKKSSYFPRINSSKKGQDLTLGTIILIVLGVAVLVFLIWGFATGWSSAWGKITAIVGGGTNIDVMKQSCELSCTSGQEAEYCQVTKIIKKGDGAKIKGSCKTLENELKVNCPSINCGTFPTPKKCGALTKEDYGGDSTLILSWNEKGDCVKGTDKTDLAGDSEGNDVNKMACCVKNP